MSNEIVSYVPQGMTEIKEFCAMVAKSNIVPKEYIGKPENVFVACLKGMDLGLKPLQALECIAVINGKTSLYGDAYLAVARGSGRLEAYTEKTEGEGMNMKAIVSVKRKGEDAVVGEFSANDAKTANLWGKSGPWALFPKRMLTMKARNYALRAVFADLFLGMEYSAEELTDIQEQQSGNNARPRDVTPAPTVKVTPVEILQETQQMQTEDRNEDRSMFKIDEAFMSGSDLYDVINAKIASIQSINDLEQYEIWKLNNNFGIKEFCKVNKEICIQFAEDISKVKAGLEG